MISIWNEYKTVINSMAILVAVMGGIDAIIEKKCGYFILFIAFLILDIGTYLILRKEKRK